MSKPHATPPIFIFLIIFFSSISTHAKAQSNGEYCYTSCFRTLDEAEAEMRSATPYGTYLIRDKTIITEGLSQEPSFQIHYRVKRQPPIYLSQPGYLIGGNGSTSNKPSICTPNSDPLLKDFCVNENEMIQGWINLYRTNWPQCSLSDQRIEGVYGEPFVKSQPYYDGKGLLSFDLPGWKWFRFNVSCPGWSDPTPVPHDTTLLKAQIYSCPTGLHPVSAFNAPYNNTGNPDYVAEYPYLCENGTETIIYAKGISQTKSCAANSNPCLPATGDKFRREDDLIFAGRSFQRFYHSLQQLQIDQGMAPGWSHSFSDTVGGGGTFMTTQEGFFEQFRSLGNGKYRGQRNSAELMLRSEDGTVSLITSAGEKRIYNSAGRLAAIQSNVSPAFDVELVYTSNRLTQAVDGLGHTLNFNYLNGALDKVSLDDGSYIQYGYDPDQNLISATRSDGSIRTYKYGEANLAPAGHAHLLTGIEEDGLRYATFSYAPDGRVASSSLHGNGTEVETTSIVYSGTSSARVNQPNGTSYTYQFGQGIFRQIESISGPDGAVAMSFERGRPISTTDRRGNTTRFTYQDGSSDEATSSRTITEASGTNYLRSQKTTRDAENRVIEQETSNAAGMTSLARSVYSGGFASFRCRYDAAAANSSAYVCGSQENAPATVRQTSYSYCTINDTAQASNNCPIAGLLKRIDSSGQGASDALQYAYFASDAPDCGSSGNTCLHRKGDLWKVTNALGRVTEYLTYDGAGRPLSVKDANGIVTDYSYHPRGWLTASKVRGADASSEADDRITRIDYWPTGLVKQVTQPDGAFTVFTYDAAHRLTDITDNAGNTVRYTLDNAGNRVKEDTTDASGTLKRTLSRVYNQLGQLKTQATAGSDPTDFEYDANGNATKVTDALATETQSEYDPLNRLSGTLQDVAGIKANATFDYDALDNLTKVTDPKGLDTKYEYNGFGDLVKLTSPDTGVTSYTYDSAGNRATQTDARGNTTAYGYDALNRLTKVTYPTTTLNVTYTYDVTQTACASGETFSIGRLTKMQDGGAITQYCYNRFGDLVRKVQTSNGKALVLRYDYTVGGQMRRMTYPDGAVVDYVRNSQGQTTEVGVTPTGGSRQVLLGNASYYPFGPAAGWTYGNGRTLARQYDLDYRPQAIHDTRPGGLEVGFGFDPAGNLTALTPAGNPTPEIGLGYDTLGRLTGLKDGRTGTLIDGYSYDATGNRLSAKVGTATQIYSYPTDSHRLSAVAGVARSYDATGNTTAIGGTARQYTYDTTGRMTQARRAGAVTMNYRYNGRGEQVRRFLGTTNTYTLYDEAGHWLGDYDNNGAPKQQAIWLDDLPVGLLANASKLHYIEPDHLGSPRVVIDPTRDVAVWTWSLKGEAFGNTAPNQDPDGDGAALVLDMRFPGQRYDAASGLNQNYFRDYEAATGRYGQSDPIGLIGGLSTYSYVEATPFTSVDATGLQGVRRLPQPGQGGFPGGYTNPNNPNNYGPNGQPAYPPNPSAGQILGGILASPMVNSSQFPLGQLISNSIAIAGTVCGEDPDRCYNRWQEEWGKCVIWGSLGARWVRACRDRARYRFQLCTSNGGTPDPNEPPEWSPSRDYPR